MLPLLIPLIGAAVNALRADADRKRQEQYATQDTISGIEQSRAHSLGGDPYAGMASNGAEQARRAQRAYEPPANEIGLAIQALSAAGGSGSDSVQDAPAPGPDATAAQYKLDHSFTPTQYGDPNDLIDPWKRR